MSPSEAALLATWRAGVEALDPGRCRVPGVLSAHWPKVHAGMRAFLDRWAEQAAALGYTTEALFGVHRQVGALRADCTGALVTVFPMRVEAVDASTITFSRGASRQTFRALTNPRESIPIWDYGRT